MLDDAEIAAFDSLRNVEPAALPVTPRREICRFWWVKVFYA
jgi:hypothetical protein